MSVHSSFKCIYCRNSRNKPGVFCHACCPSPPANHPEREGERQRQREDEAGLRCQTVYRSSSGNVHPAGNEVANCCVKPPWERPYWSLSSVNQRKEKPPRAWPRKVPHTSPSVQSQQQCWTIFIDHPGRLFTHLSFPCCIWRIVALFLWDRCVDNTVNSTDWPPNSSHWLYKEHARSLNDSRPRFFILIL